MNPIPLLSAEHNEGEPESSEIQSEHMIGGDFPNDLFGISQEKRKLTRQQKCACKQRYATQVESVPEAQHLLDIY